MGDPWAGRSSRTGPLDLTARIRLVQAAYSDAEHDLGTVLTRPSLFRSDEPATAAFLAALRTCEQLPGDGGSPIASWTADGAVGTLEVAWRRARSEAERVGLSRLGLRDRRRVRRAHRLLRKAGSDRGSVPLRLGHLHRAEKLLSGLLVLPVPLRAEIIEAARRPSRVEGPIGPGGTGGGGPV